MLGKVTSAHFKRHMCDSAGICGSDTHVRLAAADTSPDDDLLRGRPSVLYRDYCFFNDVPLDDVLVLDQKIVDRRLARIEESLGFATRSCSAIRPRVDVMSTISLGSSLTFAGNVQAVETWLIRSCAV